MNDNCVVVIFPNRNTRHVNFRRRSEWGGQTLDGCCSLLLFNTDVLRLTFWLAIAIGLPISRCQADIQIIFHGFEIPVECFTQCYRARAQLVMLVQFRCLFIDLSLSNCIFVDCLLRSISISRLLPSIKSKFLMRLV